MNNMNKFPLFIELLIKQTCRRPSLENDVFHKILLLDPATLAAVKPEKKEFYTLEFIKKLHQRARDQIYTLLGVPDAHKFDRSGQALQSYQYLVTRNFNVKERKFLLQYLLTVKAVCPPSGLVWIDLKHHIQYVYRNFASPTPDPSGETLTPFFVNEMHELVKYLLEEDEPQLFLRIIALIREYCIYAQWNYSKGGDQAITKLFYYYEAMLSAAKNCAPAFRDFETLIYKHYSVCWVDFNTCLFIRYFFETDYVQLKMYQCLEFRDSPGDPPPMFELLSDLKNLWEKEQKRLEAINDEAAISDLTDFFYIEEALMNAHKKVLKCNFWVQRPKQDMKELDLRRLDHHIFRLLFDPTFHPAGPILDKHGQCICEECLIAKYKTYIHHSAGVVSQLILDNTQRVTFCRRCEILVELDQYHKHINGHSDAEEFDFENQLRNDLVSLMNGDDFFKKSEPPKNEVLIKGLPNLKHTYFDHQRRKNRKVDEMENTMEALEKFLKDKNCDEDDNVSMAKNVKKFIKIKKDIFNHDNPGSEQLFDELASSQALRRLEQEIKIKSLKKNGFKCEKFLRNIKPVGCENKCRHEELQKPGPCTGHLAALAEMPIRRPLSDPKKCDCSFCETTATNIHKNNELRDRLRVRLHQRREKRTKEACKAQQNTNSTNNSLKLKTVISKVEERVPLPSSPTNIPPAPVVKSSDSSSSSSGLSALGDIPIRTRTPSRSRNNDDLHGLINYIEGNSGLNKIELAQKKAAKKARQRLKKEEEKRKAEEEQKRLEEEAKQKEEERKREIARKKAEQEAAGIVAAKRKSKKERQAERKLQERAAKKAAVTHLKAKFVEETIPAMVTIKRIAESSDAAPTVTITLKGSTPDQEKLLYNLVKGPEDENVEKENQDKTKKKKKQKQKNLPSVVTKELKVTVALDQNKPKAVEDPSVKKLAKNNHVKYMANKHQPNKKDFESPLPMFRLPPGITITKVEGPITNRNYPVPNPEDKKGQPSNTAKSGVIVVDTEKLINNKPIDPATKSGKKKNKKKKKKQQEDNGVPVPQGNSEPKMITLKNPIFQSYRTKNESPVDKNNEPCGPAAIFTNENGMVTIRSSRLQQSLLNGSSERPKYMPEIPLQVKLPSSSSQEDKNDISPFNAQEILSGLPGIEITKVNKSAVKPEADVNKSHPAAQVSIIPTSNGGDKFNLEDDWLYDNVFKPRDVLEDDMDPDELELEAFKRFCSQSVPPPVKDKVAHLNVAELMFKKKSNYNFV